MPMHRANATRAATTAPLPLLPLLLIAAAHAPAALAQQSANDVQALKARAGSYAVDCSKADRTRLLVSPNALSIVHGKKRLDGLKPMYAISYFGRNPPANAVAAYLGESAKRGAPGVAFIEWADKGGFYLTVESDKPTEGIFGKPALAGKFRRCP